MNRNFAEIELKMASLYMEKYLYSSIIKETQIKTDQKC